MAKYSAAIDQGTTSTRFMIFDHGGKVVEVDQREHEQIYPKPGWVEHNPMEIWQRTEEVIAEALKKSRWTPRTSRRWASPTSARRPWFGKRPPVSRSTTPSSGRTRAPTPSATTWPKTAVR